VRLAVQASDASILWYKYARVSVQLMVEWCRDIGVGKGVFKVWMHNNKHNFPGGHSARRSASSPAPAAASLQTPADGAGAAAAPSFNPSRITPPPPVLTLSPTAATGFNINVAASSAPTVATDYTTDKEALPLCAMPRNPSFAPVHRA
jgi:hypothetical protein